MRFPFGVSIVPGLVLAMACGHGQGQSADATADGDTEDADAGSPDATEDTGSSDADTEPPVCVPGSITLTWGYDPAIEGVCPVPPFELAGFRFRYGTPYDNLDHLDDVPAAECATTSEGPCGPLLNCTHGVDGLEPTVWFFSVAPYDVAGTEWPSSTPRPFDLSCPDTSGCPDRSDTIADERSYYVSDGEEQVWGYVATDGFPYYRITIESYAHHGGPTTPGTYDMTAVHTSFPTCGFCVRVYVGDTIFMPRAEGTFRLDALDPSVGGRFAGALENVVLQEVIIDPSTAISTPVPGGELQCLASYSWDTTISDT